MEIILLPLLGIAVTYIGYGPFSLKKNATAGVGFAAIGFLFRLAGPLLLVWASLLWLFVISMTRPPHRPSSMMPARTTTANLLVVAVPVCAFRPLHQLQFA
jgi:hypothetical protein